MIMAKEWTDKQREAICDRGNDLLVSAAAGSGKTAVLVERITRLILDDRVPVANMLVVTFAKAAAAEMRERIQSSLREALLSADDPETESFLLEQTAELPRASITNFHSFAASLLREQFATAGVDPAFRVADEIRAGLLQQDALDRLFENRFSETGERKEAFLSYLRSYGDSRSEDAVRNQILAVSRFLDSLPDPERWLSDAVLVSRMTREEFSDSAFCRFLLSDIDGMLGVAENAADGLVRLLASRGNVYEKNLLAIATGERNGIRAVRAAFGRSFDEGRDALLSLSFARFAASPSEKDAYAADKPLASELRSVYHKSDSGIIAKLRRTYCMRSLDDALTLIHRTADGAETLAGLVREFRALYRAAKDAEKLLDFADLEAYALSVLSDEPTRDALRARYRYIFVDEYQDSNRVQEELVQRLKADGTRLFFVGDIKQCIYHFRLAEPAIFNARMERYRKAASDPARRERTIDLNRNFRSEGSILSAINALFRELMEPTVSGFTYDGSQALVPGTAEAENAQTPVELHLIDKRTGKQKALNAPAGPGARPAGAAASAPVQADAPSPATDTDPAPEEELKEAEAEARLAARLIAEDLGKPYYNFLTKREEILRPDDVVILLRSATHASAFENALLDANIPAVCDTGESYFDTVEIAVFLNLLTVIDNLHSDEALISVLYSALYRFTADELAAIRIEKSDASYADALLFYAENGPDEALRTRVRVFLDSINRFRDEARFRPLSDFLWDLMIGTGYYYYAGALPAGQVRQANLRALTERAASYEAAGGKGLPGWIRFVRAMKDRNLKVPPVKSSPGRSAVRIMTIHKSKGLEFPFVLIPRLGNRGKNNKTDPIPLSSDAALALPFVDRTLHVHSKTLLESAIERRKAREELAEELRILYVAMTRAKHKLVLVGTATAGQMELFESGLSEARGSVTAALCFLDWILGSRDFRSAIAPPVIHSYPELASGAEPEESGRPFAALQYGFGTGPSAFKDELTRKMRWRYPYADAARTPSKMTVTEINRKTDGKDPFRIPLSVPSFARSGEKTAFSGAQRGTFLHRVLEHIPFRDGWTSETVRAFIDEMTAREFFTPEEAATVPEDAVVRFFRSPLGRRAIRAEAAGTLFRETDFTLALPGGETVQGTIDLFFRDEDGNWVLVDYKSNYLDDDENAEDALLETYRSQLLLYRKALARIKKIAVHETYLYAFGHDKALRLTE